MASFRKLMDRLADLATVPSRAAATAAPEIASLIQGQFDAGKDPYDKPWAPLKASTLKRWPHRGPPPLTDTEKMRGSVKVKPMQGAGISLTIDAPPANIHQSGSKFMAARAIFPDGSELPIEWQGVIQDATDSAFKKAMGR